ncbi:hypothetical protein [Microtetraspora malaysiensis]|uniref:hypothetical protein n=1 Tax=Microtetraspora malaysiensis TaxID=161358 RepID=UPI0008369B39|nr:hypothetical protein [Microtetraspora malaysiensis]
MRALVATGPGRLVLDEVPDPAVAPGQVLVRSRVTAVSVGTELRMLYEGRPERRDTDPPWPVIGAFGYFAAGAFAWSDADVKGLDQFTAAAGTAG